MTPDRLSQVRADAVVLAVGGVPKRWEVPGVDKVPVYTLEAYLQGAVALGRRVAVVGGQEGADAALSLARTGRQVWLLEASATYADPPYRNAPQSRCCP